MYELLKTISATKEWYFEYGRRDFTNLYNEIEDDQIHIFLDPVKIDSNFDDFNSLESNTYSGTFMLVVSSEFDQDYTTKYTENIKPLLDSTNKELLDTISCHPDITISQWSVLEVVNILDYGFDGLLITYNIEEDVQ